MGFFTNTTRRTGNRAPENRVLQKDVGFATARQQLLSLEKCEIWTSKFGRFWANCVFATVKRDFTGNVAFIDVCERTFLLPPTPPHPIKNVDFTSTVFGPLANTTHPKWFGFFRSLAVAVRLWLWNQGAALGGQGLLDHHLRPADLAKWDQWFSHAKNNDPMVLTMEMGKPITGWLVSPTLDDFGVPDFSTSLNSTT